MLLDTIWKITVESANGSFICVGWGQPQQQLWRHQSGRRVPVLVGLGAAVNQWCRAERDRWTDASAGAPASVYLGQESSYGFVFTPVDLHSIVGSKMWHIAVLGLLSHTGEMMGNAPSETLSLEYIDMHHVPKTCFNYTAAARDTGE